MSGRKSQRKGAGYEREIAKDLFDLTGLTFRRNLDQRQQEGQDDLHDDEGVWPFAVECKRYASAKVCAPSWREQAEQAAKNAGKLPSVVWRGDRMETRVTVPLSVISPDLPADKWADMDLEAYAYLGREIMAGRGSATLSVKGAIS